MNLVLEKCCINKLYLLIYWSKKRHLVLWLQNSSICVLQLSSLFANNAMRISEEWEWTKTSKWWARKQSNDLKKIIKWMGVHRFRRLFCASRFIAIEPFYIELFSQCNLVNWLLWLKFESFKHFGLISFNIFEPVACVSKMGIWGKYRLAATPCQLKHSYIYVVLHLTHVVEWFAVNR